MNKYINAVVTYSVLYCCVCFNSDGVKARAPKAKTKAKVKTHEAKAKDKVINRDQGIRQDHDEPTQYHFLLRKYLPVTNSVY